MKVINIFLLSSFLFCLLKTELKAQYVDIPDSNFRKLLIFRYPGCFNLKKQMDTTCYDIINDTSLIVDFLSIKNLAGVKYFDNLTHLNCRANEIDQLPILPAKLTVLECQSNLLKSIAGLPNTLEVLDCSFNHLSELNDLPTSLRKLNCNENQLTSIVSLPSSLTEFQCAYNPQLGNLPSLPSSLLTMNCIRDNLSNLPSLPSSLTKLELSENNITRLPDLPSKLTYLSCGANRLKGLPSLPNSLNILYCTSNQLTSLPTLPDSLILLKCDYNELVCLPYLPNTLAYFIYSTGNQIPCLPNIPKNFEVDLASKPICNATNNKNQCISYPEIKGKTFIDLNKNGSYDIGETVVPNAVVRVNDGVKSFTTSNYKGEYGFILDTLGSFVFTTDTISKYTWKPAFRSVSFNDYGNQVEFDFALQPNAILEDISTKITACNLARPGFPLSFEILNTNFGTVSSTAISSFHFPAEFKIDSVGTSGIQQSVVTWPAYSLSPFVPQKLKIYGHLDVKTTRGTKLKFFSKINLNSNSDLHPEDNVDSTILVVRSSYDPNDKVATIQLSPSDVRNGTAIDYILRFQNTGNDTAFTVVIQDTLSANLQANTLSVITSSHPCRTTVKGNVVSFEFLKINLLSIFENETASQGYVRFGVKPRTSLIVGDVVNNSADIYFDYNSPIITNNATTEIKDAGIITSVTNNSFKADLFFYPNPAYSEITLFENGEVEVYTTTGKLMLKARIRDNILDVSTLPKGIYYLKLSDPNRIVKLLRD